MRTTFLAPATNVEGESPQRHRRDHPNRPASQPAGSQLSTDQTPYRPSVAQDTEAQPKVATVISRIYRDHGSD
jgi:hypothetical protein